MSVPVVAIFLAKPGTEEIVEGLFKGVIETTLKEKGCVVYQLNKDSANPRRFIWTEEWASAEDLAVHLAAPHIQKLFAALPQYIESSEVIKLAPVAGGKA